MPDSQTLTISAGIATAVISGCFVVLAGRRKGTADFTLSLTTGFDTLTQRLLQDNSELRAEIRQLRLELEHIRSMIARGSS